MLVFNGPALCLGIVSVALTLAVAHVLGWDWSIEREQRSIVMLGFGLLGCLDLAWRLLSLKTLRVAAPPKGPIDPDFTPETPKVARPQPVMNVLNLFLSGQRGAQFFWIIPGWVAGFVECYVVFAKR